MSDGIVQTCEDGFCHVAVYSTDDGMIHVTYIGKFPTKTTQLGGMAEHPEGLARLMLGETIKQGRQS